MGVDFLPNDRFGAILNVSLVRFGVVGWKREIRSARACRLVVGDGISGGLKGREMRG